MAKFIVRTHFRPWGKRWTFALIANNGEPVLMSETYTTKGSALRSVAAIRRLAPTAAIVDSSGTPEVLPDFPEGGPDDLEPFPI